MRRELLGLICLVWAVAAACGGGTDVTPTPAMTAPPGCAELATGVFGCKATPPLLPPGATALSEYYELQSTEDTGLSVTLALFQAQTSTVDIGYYTYSSDGGWAGTVGAIALVADGAMLQGFFPSVPANVIVLRWPGAASPAATP